jgi:hypothetical protein
LIGEKIAMDKTEIKMKSCVLGLPVGFMLVAAGVSMALSYYVYSALIPYLAVSIIACYLYRKNLLKDHDSLRFDIGGPVKSEILVKGIPEGFFVELEDLIESNKLVVVSCPKDWMLRKAISDYVYNKAGFVEFKLSDQVSIEQKDLGKRAVLLSYRTKKTLQDAISHLMNRGWSISGQQGMESNLIDRVYTQRMVYEPQED